MVNLVLKTNEFEFAGKHYIQKIGCPMGSVVSPEISDMRAYELINSIIEKFPYKQNIILHRRFRDDGLIIYNGKADDLTNFFDIANSEHELLKFTFEMSNTAVNFLDMTIYKGERFKS